MSHPSQVNFVKSVRKKYPSFFKRVKAVDVGSLDINGNNKRFFKYSDYIGIDIVEGRNVDVVGVAHEKLFEVTGSVCFNGSEWVKTPNVQTIISTEALEHDKHYKKTLAVMYDVLMPGGLMVITAAGVGRPEHGTTENHAWCSPGTNDYYQNITNEMFSEILHPSLFTTYHLEQAQQKEGCDMQFYGVKSPG